MSFEERIKIREDLLAGRVPKRVPVTPSFTLEAACGFAGIELIKAHYDMELAEKAYTALCENFYSDTMPAGNLRFPAVYQILGAKNWILASNGAVQHPEIETLMAEEYDEFIADPYGCMVEKLLPRVCAAMDTDPVNQGLVMAKAHALLNKVRGAQMGLTIRLRQKYGYMPGLIAGQLIEAPFDFLADQLRGFKAINMDIRRMPDKIEAAVNAILPIMLKLAIPTTMRPGIINMIPLHLAPYIRMKDFERLYWPTLEKLVVESDKLGVSTRLFAEQDWTRYAEYLERLPESSILAFENGDYAHIKATAGKKHVIGGFFDPTITLTRSKEECIDEAKRLIDVCAPGGRFFFNFDREIMDIHSVDVPKLQAVLDWVHVNTDY